MIGVLAKSEDQVVVREFFELFKTPWEFYSADHRYDVVICAEDVHFAGSAKVVLCYAGRKTEFDLPETIQTSGHRKSSRVLSYKGHRIPIYGDTISFATRAAGFLADEESQECIGYSHGSRDATVVRIGYDLFNEVRTLLTFGQPPANAGMPALELHIEVLRDVITGCGVSLVEIPPVPVGYGLMVCLTHDVDHPSIRNHKWDHTMFGFLYRAVFGSLRNFIRGRLSVRNLLANWAAVLKLPFVYLGVSKDFWREFDDRYLEIERKLHSTFFVIPYRDSAGRNASGPARAIRAAGYRARDIADSILKLRTAGCEVGLHGIDAWIDSSSGREELDEIRRLTGDSEIGVRMHWLYYDQQSPTILESAGAAYDSTIGYNETVGYRAGTTQVYRPFDTNHLLELPLHVMDTALFYPSYLGLSERQAKTLVGRMVDDVFRLGGTMTINWHDRSLASERLWGDCYRDLIQDLKNRGAWFATAGEAVSWFQKRRSASFEADPSGSNRVRTRVAAEHGKDLPGLRLRVHRARTTISSSATHRSDDHADTPLNEFVDTTVTSEAAR